MEEEAAKLVFGVAAQGRAPLEAQLPTLLAWIGARAGVVLSHRVATSYEKLADAVQEESVDIAWLPPLVFVRLERKQLVVPLATLQRGGQSTYEAVLVVRADSKIDSLEALRGTRAAWVDPLSAAGYVLPRGQLDARGLPPDALFVEERFLGTHTAALEAVRSGEADVAGTHGATDAAGELLEGAHGQSLRVLARFGGIPADVIAARRGIDEGVRAKVAQAFVDAAADAEMRPVARAVFGVESFVLGSEASYAGWHRSLPAALASGLLVAIDADEE